MHMWDAYFSRKGQELNLLGSYLGSPCLLVTPRSIDEIIERKFRLAAELKAERALAGWSASETGWTGEECKRFGPYELRYGYQRADLAVHGPVIYEALKSVDSHVEVSCYTSSGMSAISSVLMALTRVFDAATIDLPRPGYSETADLIQNYGRGFRIETSGTRRPASSLRMEKRILLIDFCSA